jgi:hypothetical protein
VLALTCDYPVAKRDWAEKGSVTLPVAACRPERSRRADGHQLRAKALSRAQKQVKPGERVGPRRPACVPEKSLSLVFLRAHILEHLYSSKRWGHKGPVALACGGGP